MDYLEILKIKEKERFEKEGYRIDICEAKRRIEERKRISLFIRYDPVFTNLIIQNYDTECTICERKWYLHDEDNNCAVVPPKCIFCYKHTEARMNARYIKNIPCCKLCCDLANTHKWSTARIYEPYIRAFFVKHLSMDIVNLIIQLLK